MAALPVGQVLLDPEDDPGSILNLDREPQDDQERSGRSHPARQRSGVLDPVEQQRDELLHDGGGTDAVGQAGKLFQTVGLKSPVSGEADVLLAVEERTAEVVAVLAALSGKLKDTVTRESVDDVNHVGDHRFEDVDVRVWNRFVCHAKV